MSIENQKKIYIRRMKAKREQKILDAAIGAISGFGLFALMFLYAAAFAE